MPVDKSLISGSTSMLILKLLEEKDMYGYEMIETLREKSRNVFELKAGTLWSPKDMWTPMSRRCWERPGNTTALQRKGNGS